MIIKRLKRNIKGQDYILGDLHGYIKDLYTHLNQIGFDKKKDRLICVGDLIDRGPDNEMVLKLLKEPWFYSVRGNHEQMAIDIAKSPYFHDTERYGAGWLCFSPKNIQMKYAKEFDKLPHVIEIETTYGKIGVVHADTNFEDWNVFIKDVMKKEEEVLNYILWKDYRFKSKNETVIKNIERVYVGHITNKDILQLGNVYYIDLGICEGAELKVIPI